MDGTSEIGIDGKRQEYDWELILKTIHKLQPNAVTAFYGDDIRWIGKESARGRRRMEFRCVGPGVLSGCEKRNEEMRLSVFSRDLGGKEIIDRATELFWYPSEVSVSIRPSWFYHEREDSKVKSLSELVRVYFQSVDVILLDC